MKVSDELLKGQLECATSEAEAGRIFPMEEWLTIVGSYENAPVDKINKIRQTGYRKGISYQLELADFYAKYNRRDGAEDCLQLIESYSERGNLPLPTEEIDAIIKKLNSPFNL